MIYQKHTPSTSRFRRHEFVGYSYGSYDIVREGRVIDKLIFKTFSSSGHKPEGGLHSCFFTTPEIALDELDRHLTSHFYFEDSTGSKFIHWRMEPSVTKLIVYQPNLDDAPIAASGENICLKPLSLYVATCRLALSDERPIL